MFYSVATPNWTPDRPLTQSVAPAELRVHPGHAEILGRRVPQPHPLGSGVGFLGR